MGEDEGYFEREIEKEREAALGQKGAGEERKEGRMHKKVARGK